MDAYEFCIARDGDRGRCGAPRLRGALNLPDRAWADILLAGEDSHAEKRAFAPYPGGRPRSQPIVRMPANMCLAVN